MSTRPFIVTFGFGQSDPNTGEPLGNCYAVVYARSEVEARMIMHKHHGGKWSFIYGSEHEAGVEEFGLKQKYVYRPGVDQDTIIEDAKEFTVEMFNSL